MSTATMTTTTEPNAPHSRRRRGAPGRGAAGTLGGTVSVLLVCMVVGGSIAIVLLTIRGQVDQTATVDRRRGRAPKRAKERRSVREPIVATTVPAAAAMPTAPVVALERTSLGRRLRSGVELALLLAVLGALSALAVGLLAVALVTGLRQAIG